MKIIKIHIEQIYRKMLFDKFMRLSKIPQSFRVKHVGIYVTAFRVDRAISIERYIEDLEIMFNDISVASWYKENIKHTYFEMKNNFEYYKKSGLFFKFNKE